MNKSKINPGIKLVELILSLFISINPLLAQKKMEKQAILIIDVQKDFTSVNAKSPVDKTQAEEMITNINILTKKTLETKMEIVYVGNEFSKWNLLNIFRNFAAVKGSPGIKFDPRLQVVNEVYFPKNQGDAFSNPNLDNYLKQFNISKLYITGLKAEACIYFTLKGALRHHYDTTVLTDCIATGTDNKRLKMIKKYKKLGAATISSTQLIHQIDKENNLAKAN